MNQEYRLAIFASGSGTNAEQIFAYFKNHTGIRIAALFSNNPHAFVLTRAENHGIDSIIFDRIQFNDGTVLKKLKTHKVTHIILAGFLWLIPQEILKEYQGCVINIHPSLLPAFGGKGMYGMKVHEAVKASGATETGITIHEVNERYDEGRIVFQKSVPVTSDDSPDEIAEKVHKLEHRYFPPVIESWLKNILYNGN